ncbi:MAG: hypothetical protein ACOYKM_12230 [Caulobacterales bacterium]|jgi:membrane-bound inhibitor of C-type lysozyme
MNKGMIGLVMLGLAVGCSQPAPQAPPPAASEQTTSPAPDAAPSRSEISYACTDGLRFVIVQDLDAGSGVFQVEGGGAGVAVEKAVVASGFAYYAEGIRFHGHGSEAILNYRTDPERTCRLIAER